MKVMAINGSPRKNWNTDTLLKKVLEGAASAGAETEMVYLYDLKFRGCVSCMTCKLKNGKSLGRCALKDDLTAVLERAHEADAVVLGSPIYFSDVTGEMRSFLERFLFQYLNYDDFSKPLSTPKKTALVFTMNVPESKLDEYNYRGLFQRHENLMKVFFRVCTTLLSTDTLQVNDYGKYHLAGFDGEAKRLRRETVFPKDCRKAFELGVKLATEGVDDTEMPDEEGENILDSPELYEYPIALDTFEAMFEYTLRNIGKEDKKRILRDLLQFYPVLGPVCDNLEHDLAESERFRTDQMSSGESFVFGGTAPDLIMTITGSFTPTLEFPAYDKEYFKICKHDAKELVTAYWKDRKFFDSMIHSFEEPYLIEFICDRVVMFDLPKEKRKPVMQALVAWGILLSCARHCQREEKIGENKKGNNKLQAPGKEKNDFDKNNIQVLQLHVKLVGYKVSADVLVREDTTFEELHFFLNNLFERDDDHLYRFECDDGLVAVRPEEDYDEAFEDVTPTLAGKCYVGHHLSPGKGAHYVFDYGDYWEHEITVKDILSAAPGERYPRVIKVRGKIPEQYPDRDDEDGED